MATRAEIKLKARQRADMERSTFIGDTELNTYVQDSYGELYDLLVSAYEDYYLTELSFTIASGSSSYTIPATLYKLRGLDLQDTSGVYRTLAQFNFAERNARSRAVNRVLSGGRDVVYRLMGDKIYFLPESHAPGNYKLWYIPRVTTLSSDSDQLVGILDFDDYVAVDCGIKMLTKEESDISALLMEKQSLVKRIQDMRQNRDVGSPQVIGDVATYGTIDDIYFPR